MRDTNTALLKSYFNSLQGITYNSIPVPVYSGIVPDNINPNNYILFGEVTDNENSTKNSSDNISLIRVTIHTFDEKYNSPIIVNSIANEIFQRVYPDVHFNLALDENLQMYSTEKFSDTTQHLTLDANRAYIDRVIVFKHKIYQR